MEKTIKIGEDNNIGKDEKWCYWYECPNCKDRNTSHGQKFCGECGIKLEWLDYQLTTPPTQANGGE